jgi:acyl carrier protein
MHRFRAASETEREKDMEDETSNEAVLEERVGSSRSPDHAQGEPEAAIREWLKSYVANLLGMHVDDVDGVRSFEHYGLDSSAAIGMTGDLSEWLGREVDVTAAYDHPTIDELARELAAQR